MNLQDIEDDLRAARQRLEEAADDLEFVLGQDPNDPYFRHRIDTATRIFDEACERVDDLQADCDRLRAETCGWCGNRRGFMGGCCEGAWSVE